MNTHNSYLFKAIDAYPYNLEETMEALGYALSYDPKDAEALYLMAKVYAYQLRDCETAKQYFEAAMIQHIEMSKLYPDYVYCLLINNDLQEADRLIEYALKVKGVDTATLHLLKGQILESKEAYKKALKVFKEAKILGKNNDFIRFVNNEIKRIKEKLPKKKKSKKVKRKEKKTSRSN